MTYVAETLLKKFLVLQSAHPRNVLATACLRDSQECLPWFCTTDSKTYPSSASLLIFNWFTWLYCRLPSCVHPPLRGMCPLPSCILPLPSLGAKPPSASLLVGLLLRSKQTHFLVRFPNPLAACYFQEQVRRRTWLHVSHLVWFSLLSAAACFALFKCPSISRRALRHAQSPLEGVMCSHIL